MGKYYYASYTTGTTFKDVKITFEDKEYTISGTASVSGRCTVDYYYSPATWDDPEESDFEILSVDDPDDIYDIEIEDLDYEDFNEDEYDPQEYEDLIFRISNEKGFIDSYKWDILDACDDIDENKLEDSIELLDELDESLETESKGILSLIKSINEN